MASDRRCSRCGLLLCKEENGELIVRDQKNQYMFSGGVLKTVCRRCGSLEVIAPTPTAEHRNQADQAH